MSDPSTVEAVRAALNAFVDPYLGETLGGAKAIRDLTTSGDKVHAKIALGFPVGGYHDEFVAGLLQHIAASGLKVDLTVDLEPDIRSHAVQRNLKPIDQIKNVVAVASGKGGVGKSTVA